MQGQRILLVSAGMGAGHDQCARELARRFTERGAEVRVVDLLALLPLRLGSALRGFYGGMLAHAPWLYSAIYRVFMADHRDASAGRRGVSRSRPMAMLGARALAPVVDDFAPTAVVSTFHLAGQAVGELRRCDGHDYPSVVVITEMVAHAMWLGGGADLYCCISEPIARQVHAATGADAIGPGPLIDPRFRRPSGREAAAAEPNAQSAVLVSTGSWGIGDILETVAALAAVPGIRPVALCGRNARLHRRVAALPGATALGWRDDMPALLAGAAVVVDNAGGSMCMEALAAGVPVVEYRPIAGHGVPVARALVEHGLVTGADDAAALVRAVDALRRPGPRRSAQVERGAGLFRADPAAEIARWLEPHIG